MESEGIRYINLILKRWWLIILAVAIAGGLAYFYRTRQPVYYQAEAKIFAGNVLDTQNPSVGLLEYAQKLAVIYGEVVRRHDVLTATIEALNLPLTSEELRKKIGTYVVPETPILVVTVTDIDPDRAAAIANELAASLILNSPDQLPKEQQQTMETLRQQIEDLQQQITTSSGQALDVFEKLSAAREQSDEAQIAELTDQYNRLIDQLNSARATLAQASETFVSLSDRENKLEIFEPARSPTDSVGIKPIIVGGAGGIVGGILAVVTVLFFDYIDDTFRSELEVVRTLDLPVLGVIAHSRSVRGARKEYLATGTLTKSAVSEQYRTIQANLLFSADGLASNRAYILTSPDIQEGRSFTTANLAVIVAETGLQILLIDADIRKSQLHEIFGLENKLGLTDMVYMVTENPDVFKGQSKEQIIQVMNNHIQSTRTPGLDVITIGSRLPETVSQSSSIKNVQTIVENIEKAFVYDLIIFNTPPTQFVADSFIIAGATKANVVLLVEVGRTNRNVSLKAKDQFLRVGSKINGIVLDKG